MVHNKKTKYNKYEHLKKNVFIYIYKQLEMLHVEIWIKKKKKSNKKIYIYFTINIVQKIK